MDQQQSLVKQLNGVLKAKGLINTESGFSCLNCANSNEVFFQPYRSILGSEEDVSTVTTELSTESIDRIVLVLHSQKKKCVFFVADHHILKAAETQGIKNFYDYHFLDGFSTITVYGAMNALHDVTSLDKSGEGAFMVYRRGLYVYGDDPWKLLKRLDALHLAIASSQ